MGASKRFGILRVLLLLLPFMALQVQNVVLVKPGAENVVINPQVYIYNDTNARIQCGSGSGRLKSFPEIDRLL